MALRCIYNKTYTIISTVTILWYFLAYFSFFGFVLTFLGL